MTDRSDEDLIEAWQRGDADAFDEIVTRYSARVFGICFRYFGNADQAEEATQETFVTLHRRGGSYRAQAKFSTWLYRVTTNVCHDLGRKQARRPEVVPLPDQGSGPDDITTAAGEDALQAAELESEITAALRSLEPDQRTAVVLHDVYGYPYEDIARRTGVAVGTVKSRIHRGHARLAEALAHLRSRPSGSGAATGPAARGAPSPPARPSPEAEPSRDPRHLTE